MGNDGNILPQAEIDSLFNQVAGKNLETSDISNTQSTTSLKKDPDKYSDNDEKFDEIMKAIEQLTRRIEKLEENISDRNRSNKDVTDNGDIEKQLLQKTKKEEINLHQISRRVSNIVNLLNETPGYGVRGKYTCNNCGANGFIAIPMKCSCCGTEGWLGWWPE